MCAIAGILGLENNGRIFDKMQKTMTKRGPDASGMYQYKNCVLIHTRLTVVDPENGGQPMTLDWAGERYVIVYNGELYNTQQLRKELEELGHRFHGHSDTEVVLHAYAQWREACLELFNGIFAFAVWCEKAEELFLVRDRIGVKPLFYKQHNGGLLFASEIKTILQYPSVDAQLDQNGIAQLLLLGPGRMPGSGVFRGIWELEPGCYGSYCKGKWHWRRYWYLKDAEHRDSFADTVEKVRYLVQDAIERQMVSDVPVGTFLSGGLDSSLISAVCAGQMEKKGQRLNTFSVDYEGNDRHFIPGKFQPNSDNSYIEIMSDSISSDHHWTRLKPQQLVDGLEEAVMARDLPGMADVDSSLLLFCKDVRKYVKVALSGECADEIFGGYPWYTDPEVLAKTGFPWAQNTVQRASLLHPSMNNFRAIDFVKSAYERTVRESDILPETSEGERRMKQMVNLNLRWFMQTLLDRKDRMSMYSGLEVRVPFCDYRIAEYLYHVPWEYKAYGGKEKGLLRYAMSDFLPEQVLWRKKSPYPKTHDPFYERQVFSLLGRVLDDPAEPLHQLINIEALRQLLMQEQKWPWYGQLMRGPQTGAYMLMINHWMKIYSVNIV